MSNDFYSTETWDEAQVSLSQPADSENADLDVLGRGKREKIPKTVFSPLQDQPRPKVIAATVSTGKPNEAQKSLRPLPRAPLALLGQNKKTNTVSGIQVQKGDINIDIMDRRHGLTCSLTFTPTLAHLWYWLTIT